MSSMKKYSLLIGVVLCSFSALFAGGIKGIIRGDDGAPLPFASVFIKQTAAGAATDLSGRFELSLPPGQYDVLFQYLGYETQLRKIEIVNDF